MQAEPVFADPFSVPSPVQEMECGGQETRDLLVLGRVVPIILEPSARLLVALDLGEARYVERKWSVVKEGNCYQTKGDKTRRGRGR